MRVLQIGTCAGIPHALADASGGDVAFIDRHIFNYTAEREIRLGAGESNPFFNTLTVFKNLYNIKNNYDILHFHGGTILPRCLDIPIWKNRNKKIILHYHGSEIRNYPGRYLLSMARYADRVLVSTPDLLKFVPGSVWMPNPVSLEGSYSQEKKTRGDLFTIFHAPTNSDIKGTSLIRKAIESVKRKGYSIKWVCSSGQDHKTILRAMSESDVVIDQVNSYFGVYGLISCEAMAMNKPVICSINPEYDNLYQGCPILKIRNDNPGEIEDHLITLMGDASMRECIGEVGRRYVEAIHNPKIIVEKIYNF